MRSLLLGGAAACLIPCLHAQVLPGQSIATVAVSGQPGEMYLIDHDAGTATALTISAALAADGPNCVMMLDPVNGLVGTTGNSGGSGNVYGITVQGQVVAETLLNTTPTLGASVAQVAVLGNRVYFCTQNAGAVGAIQSVPLTGGPSQVHLDLATLGGIGLANAICELGGKIYCATFNSSPSSTATTPGELFEFDPATSGGRLVMNLPSGGFSPNGNPWNTGIVNMAADPQNVGGLVLQGVYGELLEIDPATATVTRQVWTGVHNAGGNALASGSVNSFAWDPIAEDWIVGTRDGHAERWVDGGQAHNKIPGLGTGATPTSNSVTGIAHSAGLAGSDVSIGPGCRGNGDWFPTDSSFGAPVGNNAQFKFGLFATNGGDNVVLLLDVQNVVLAGMPLPLNLNFIGAPGCLIRTGNLIAVGVATTGSGEGNGRAIVPVPIPGSAVGLTLYRQWAELQVAPTNTLGVVLSNARRMTVQ